VPLEVAVDFFYRAMVGQANDVHNGSRMNDEGFTIPPLPSFLKVCGIKN